MRVSDFVTFQGGGASVQEGLQVGGTLFFVQKHRGAVDGPKLQMRPQEFRVLLESGVEQFDGLRRLAAQ